MPTASYVKYTAAIEPLLEGINAGTDSWKIALALTVNAADTTFTAGTTDLATAGGYTAGGNAASITSAAQTAGTYKLVLASPCRMDRIWRWIYVSICDTLGCYDQHPGGVLGLWFKSSCSFR